jgi:hypothetical protein
VQYLSSIVFFNLHLDGDFFSCGGSIILSKKRGNLFILAKINNYTIKPWHLLPLELVAIFTACSERAIECESEFSFSTLNKPTITHTKSPYKHYFHYFLSFIIFTAGLSSTLGFCIRFVWILEIHYYLATGAQNYYSTIYNCILYLNIIYCWIR